MDNLFSILALSILLTINIAHGIIGGVYGSLISSFVTNNRFRRAVAFALVSIFILFVPLQFQSSLKFYQAIRLFAPLFTIIGLIWSIFFKRRIKDASWLWLALFPLIGMSAAIIYQSHDKILWSAILLSIAGVVALFSPHSRLHRTIPFAALGAILAWTLFMGLLQTSLRQWSLSTAVNLNYLYPLTFIAGGIIGGAVGFITRNEEIRWIIVLGILGTLTASVISYINLRVGLLPILLIGTVSGLIGLIIKLPISTRNDINHITNKIYEN